MNRHVGIYRGGIEHALRSFSILKGEWVINFCVSNLLATMNTFYNHKKGINGLGTNTSTTMNDNHTRMSR